jgi:hypothetical protein
VDVEAVLWGEMELWDIRTCDLFRKLEEEEEEEEGEEAKLGLG